MNSSKYYMLRKCSLFSLLVMPALLFAQENVESAKPAQVKNYVRSTFENPVLINNQTVENYSYKSLDFIIQHRFGIIKNADDLFGLYAPSNIRLGIAYGITKRLSLGIGVTKHKMLYDFQGKYVILRQTETKGTPVSLTYYGDIARSSQDKDNFLNQDNEFKQTNKLSYFHEIMVARKINRRLSVQLAGTYSHMNIIDSVYDQHDFFGVSFVGRYKFSPQSSIIIDCDYLLNVSGIESDYRPKPNFSIGYEVSTGSHQFQVFVSTGQEIVNQEYRVFNQNDFFKGDVALGFNITRNWSFKK